MSSPYVPSRGPHSKGTTTQKTVVVGKTPISTKPVKRTLAVSNNSKPILGAMMSKKASVVKELPDDVKEALVFDITEAHKQASLDLELAHWKLDQESKKLPQFPDGMQFIINPHEEIPVDILPRCHTVGVDKSEDWVAKLTHQHGEWEISEWSRNGGGWSGTKLTTGDIYRLLKTGWIHL